MREIILDWTTAAGGGRKSVIYASTDSVPSAQLADLKTFFEAIKTDLASSTIVTFPSTGRELDPASGGLTGEWSTAAPAPTQGTGLGSPVADASQILLRWRTGVVRRGRFVTGRLFIPGATSATINNGNVSAATLGRINAAAGPLVASPNGIVVWARPTASQPGSSYEVNAASAWSEFAVLRRRRS